MTDQAVDTNGPAGVAGTAGAKEPPDVTPPHFFGRERELKALEEDIEGAGLDTLAGRKAARARVLLIAGRPGSGRTALASELARRLAEPGDHPDGVFRVALTEPGGERVPANAPHARSWSCSPSRPRPEPARTSCPRWSARRSPHGVP